MKGKTVSIEAEISQSKVTNEEIIDEEIINNQLSVVLQERFARSIKKSYKFDKLIDANASSIEYVNGVLQITLAKSEESKPVKLNL